MTKKQFKTRKVISIAIAAGTDGLRGRFVALCDDGSMWTAWDNLGEPDALFDFKWEIMPPIPQGEPR